MEFFIDNLRIGSLKEGVFRKKVKKSEHLMKQQDGWGIQLKALEELYKQGCTEIRILDLDENKVYSTPFDRVWKEGEVSLHDDNQAFLPRSKWTITDNK